MPEPVRRYRIKTQLFEAEYVLASDYDRDLKEARECITDMLASLTRCQSARVQLQESQYQEDQLYYKGTIISLGDAIEVAGAFLTRTGA